MPTKLFQYSTITSLMHGNYDGEINFKDFKTKGDFGLGTFEGLDGEMIVLDKNFYQTQMDGSLSVINESYTSPFLSICNFVEDEKMELNGLNVDQVMEEIEKGETSKIIAIKIEGEFETITTRSVKKQEKPYKKMFEIKDVQQTVTFENNKGTIVGFYTPKYLNTVGVEGVHFHYVTSELTSGGHVLEFKMKNAILTKSYIDEIELKLGKASFGQEDIQEHIKKLEGNN
ncbi:acetolactate decarboxylase [Spiroplasma chinense]|uniref:Alpha-acetolactate decarboxylase n=1 Tax=Spiroplasma chinense TaxID=216932 RepID=A0A5B9Y332_9MOLU|nr:acetolactate decarboxylase [Spiroplasma chinense]QEH61484.1 acetolactate decarboxylase [Spiroplasma chinense]